MGVKYMYFFKKWRCLCDACEELLNSHHLWLLVGLLEHGCHYLRWAARRIGLLFSNHHEWLKFRKKTTLPQKTLNSSWPTTLFFSAKHGLTPNQAVCWADWIAPRFTQHPKDGYKTKTWEVLSSIARNNCSVALAKHKEQTSTIEKLVNTVCVLSLLILLGHHPMPGKELDWIQGS